MRTTKVQLAYDVLELADAGGMPDSYRLTDSRVGRALDAITAAGEDVPQDWAPVAKARAESAQWGGANMASEEGKQ